MDYEIRAILDDALSEEAEIEKAIASSYDHKDPQAIARLSLRLEAVKLRLINMKARIEEFNV